MIKVKDGDADAKDFGEKNLLDRFQPFRGRLLELIVESAAHEEGLLTKKKQNFLNSSVAAEQA